MYLYRSRVGTNLATILTDLIHRFSTDMADHKGDRATDDVDIEADENEKSTFITPLSTPPNTKKVNNLQIRRTSLPVPYDVDGEVKATEMRRGMSVSGTIRTTVSRDEAIVKVLGNTSESIKELGARRDEQQTNLSLVFDEENFGQTQDEKYSYEKQVDLVTEQIDKGLKKRFLGGEDFDPESDRERNKERKRENRELYNLFGQMLNVPKVFALNFTSVEKHVNHNNQEIKRLNGNLAQLERNQLATAEFVGKNCVTFIDHDELVEKVDKQEGMIGNLKKEIMELKARPMETAIKNLEESQSFKDLVRKEAKIVANSKPKDVPSKQTESLITNIQQKIHKNDLESTRVREMERLAARSICIVNQDYKYVDEENNPNSEAQIVADEKAIDDFFLKLAMLTKYTKRWPKDMSDQIESKRRIINAKDKNGNGASTMKSRYEVRFISESTAQEILHVVRTARGIKDCEDNPIPKHILDDLKMIQQLRTDRQKDAFRDLKMSCERDNYNAAKASPDFRRWMEAGMASNTDPEKQTFPEACPMTFQYVIRHCRVKGKKVTKMAMTRVYENERYNWEKAARLYQGELARAERNKKKESVPKRSTVPPIQKVPMVPPIQEVPAEQVGPA